MTIQQLEQLLSLYKSAVKRNLTVGEFEQEIKSAQLSLDRSFVTEGKEDMNLGEYLEELKTLKHEVLAS